MNSTESYYFFYVATDFYTVNKALCDRVSLLAELSLALRCAFC